MALLQLRDISLSFGTGPILDEVNLAIEEGERLCLVGRNGQGKSCLMKVVYGALEAESGSIKRKQDLRIAYLPQDVPQDIQGTISEVVSDGLGDARALLKRFETLSMKLAEDQSPGLMQEFEALQNRLDETNGWDLEQRIENHLSRFGLDGNARFESLSGGMKRRVLLARALVIHPDLLMLDEPTNHLDVEAIRWLEEFLIGYPGAILFVTHDRMFLRTVATRIIDLDRGRLTSWPGDYDLYRERKEAALEVEANEWSEFDKKLAQEEAWIRQGIKARRTRNEGRVRALKRLRVERSERRERIGQAKMKLQEADRSGKVVAKVEGLNFSWPDKKIVANFDTTIMRGDRVAIIGPNGCGKTTLIRLLLGELEPDGGDVKLGTKLEVLYFDQLRGQLDPEATVQENVSDGNDTVMVGGRPRHILGYLKDFLFSPHRARSPVKALSGGERNRLLLARLFTHEANVLVLDEPTNDLDVETLELLETILLDFKGTLLLVSHDREFVNNVVTSTIAFDEDNEVRAYVGGYDDWWTRRVRVETVDEPITKKQGSKNNEGSGPRPRKLSYRENEELAAIPIQIEELEEKKSELEEALADPELYREGPGKSAPIQASLAETETTLETLYLRWEELEAIREAFAQAQS